MALHFLDFTLGSNNCYRTLARKARGAIFATLNYEWLLDEALIELGSVRGIMGERQPGRAILLKLHGAANLVPDIQHVSHIEISCYIEAIAAEVSYLERSEAKEIVSKFGPGGAPCMALYAPGKPVLYSAEVVRRIQSDFVTELANARQVFIVGAKCWPADEHLWTPLADAAARLIFVNPDDVGRAEFLKWAAAERPERRSNVWPLTFKQFVASL